MSGEMIAILTVGVALAGLIPTSNRGLRQDSRKVGCIGTLAICFLGLAPGASWGQQSPFSVQVGLIFEAQGQCDLLKGSGSEPTEGQRHLEAGQRVHTEAGRVELILAPGIFLAVGQNTQLVMIKPQLSELKLELISGSVSLSAVDDSYLEGLSIRSGDAEVRFDKRGVYRLDAPTGERLRVKVFRGRAVVFANESDHKVKKRWSLAVAEAPSDPLFKKFDTSKNDALDQWHEDRVAAIERAALRGREQRDRLNQGPSVYDQELAKRRGLNPGAKIGPPDEGQKY